MNLPVKQWGIAQFNNLVKDPYKSNIYQIFHITIIKQFVTLYPKLYSRITHSLPELWDSIFGKTFFLVSEPTEHQKYVLLNNSFLEHNLFLGPGKDLVENHYTSLLYKVQENMYNFYKKHD